MRLGQGGEARAGRCSTSISYKDPGRKQNSIRIALYDEYSAGWTKTKQLISDNRRCPFGMLVKQGASVKMPRDKQACEAAVRLKWALCTTCSAGAGAKLADAGDIPRAL